MPSSIDLPANAMVALTRDSFVSLRAALFRDVGANAAALLQEAGFAGGPAVFAAFGAWLEARGLGSPETLAAAEFAPVAAQFFHESGWGSLHLGTLSNVATIDSDDWAEADPRYPMDFPGCYYTSGVLSDFFGRLAGQPLAVMEVECRSAGAERCRFLLGSGESMQRVYDRMSQGESYVDALSASA
jgi:predicted hydrocarbon binding protein